MAGDWKDRIFREKSLWEVYRLSASVLPRPKFNRFIAWLFSILIAAFFAWVLCDSGRTFTVQDALEFLRFSAAQGVALSIGILGFLVAGFAIFASVTRAELFITLAEIPYKRNGVDTGINRLLFIFFNFINVFTVYIGLLSLSMIVAMGLSEHSPVLRIAGNTRSPFPMLPLVFLVILNGGITFWIAIALLKLKSFIWNLYQTVLVAIATEAELLKRPKGQGQ